MEDQTQKTVKVLTRIKDYFLEAIDKFSKTVGDASKTLQDSLKRIEKDLKAIELGGLPTSERSASTAVIATVLAKRGELMSTQDLWAAISGKIPIPAQVADAATVKEAEIMEESTIEEKVIPSGVPSISSAGPPSAVPSSKPSIPSAVPPSAESQIIDESEMETPMVSVPTMAAAPSMAFGEEKPTVGTLKSEMLKELKRLKKLMTGIT